MKERIPQMTLKFSSEKTLEPFLETQMFGGRDKLAGGLQNTASSRKAVQSLKSSTPALCYTVLIIFYKFSCIYYLGSYMKTYRLL